MLLSSILHLQNRLKSKISGYGLVLRDKTVRYIVRDSYKARFASLLPHVLDPEDWMDFWYLKPLNGQTQRIKHIVRLADSFLPTLAIETGTYFGTSTPLLSRLVSGRTYTIEANPEYYKKAMNRLKGDLEYIEVVFGDSTLEMKSILERYSNQSESILAYLDAHWYKNVPTRKELELLLNWGGKWIAVIDDFEIPTDSGYTFDKYEDQIVGIGMVPIGVDLEVWVSTVNSRNESGAKRGTGYVFSPGTRSQLSELALKDMVKIL